MKSSAEWSALCCHIAAKIDAHTMKRDALLRARSGAALEVAMGEPRAKLDKVNADLTEAEAGLQDAISAMAEAMLQEEVTREAEESSAKQARTDTLNGLMKARKEVCEALVSAARPFIAAIQAEKAQREVCLRERVTVPHLNQAPAWTIALCQAAKEAGLVHPFSQLEGLDMHPDFSGLALVNTPYVAGFSVKAKQEI